MGPPPFIIRARILKKIEKTLDKPLKKVYTI